MHFLAWSSRLAADERVACYQQDGRRRGGSRRAIALQDRPSSFYWQPTNLTAVFVVAVAILGVPAAHGAEKFPAYEDLPSDVAQASEHDEPIVRDEGKREVSNASAV